MTEAMGAMRQATGALCVAVAVLLGAGPLAAQPAQGAQGAGGNGDETPPAAANVPEYPATPEESPPAAAAGVGTGARPARRYPPAYMFTRADDAAERARMRTPAARRLVRGQPEVLELAGMPDAWFYRPRGGGMRRVFVYLHSRGADPKEACQRFSAVVPQYGWLVCPVGPGHRGGGRYVWNNNALLARRYAVASVAALRARFPRRVRATDNVVMGFSEGAFVAMQTGLMEPTLFPRWVIFSAHDGYIGMNTELYPAARQALRRIYLLTGANDEIVERSRRAEALMRRQRLGTVQLRILPRANHELPPEFVPEVRRALAFVTAAPARARPVRRRR